jgi:hypothetical protein
MDEVVERRRRWSTEDKVHHVVVEGEDALIAALKVKCRHPEALIIYVRRRNRRGDARHPPVAEKM